MNFVRNIIKCATQVPIKSTLVSNVYKGFNKPLLDSSADLVSRFTCLTIQERTMGTSLYRMHRRGPHKKVRNRSRPLDGNPFLKGVVLKTLIKKPKKPNSANRKCVLVRLSNGKEMVAYVPGIGHNLQEHNIVLCRVGRLQDCPGVKIKCVRGKYDLGHVIPAAK